MKFLIDADCPRAAGTLLRQNGYEVLDIRDINPSAADHEIYELIRKDSLILVTRDTDFGNILLYPAAKNCGIILLRAYLLSVDEIITLISDFIRAVPPAGLLGCLAVVKKGKYRIHTF